MNEYEIYLPLRYNDGRPIEEQKFSRLRESLLERFQGLTILSPSQGYWKMGDVTYRDEIVIYRILAGDDDATKAFFAEFREQLKKEFEQHEILIVARKADTA